MIRVKSSGRNSLKTARASRGLRQMNLKFGIERIYRQFFGPSLSTLKDNSPTGEISPKKPKEPGTKKHIVFMYTTQRAAVDLHFQALH